MARNNAIQVKDFKKIIGDKLVKRNGGRKIRIPIFSNLKEKFRSRQLKKLDSEIERLNKSVEYFYNLAKDSKRKDAREAALAEAAKKKYELDKLIAKKNKISKATDFEVIEDKLQNIFPKMSKPDISRIADYYNENTGVFEIGNEKFDINNLNEEKKKEVYASMIRAFNDMEDTEDIKFARKFENFGKLTYGDKFIRDFAKLELEDKKNVKQEFCYSFILPILAMLEKDNQEILAMNKEEQAEELKGISIADASLDEKHLQELREKYKQPKALPAATLETEQTPAPAVEPEQTLEPEQLLAPEPAQEPEVIQTPTLEENVDENIKTKEEIHQELFDKISKLSSEERKQRNSEIEQEKFALFDQLDEERRKNERKTAQWMAFSEYANVSSDEKGEDAERINAHILNKNLDQEALDSLAQVVDKTKENELSQKLVDLNNEQKIILEVTREEIRKKNEEKAKAEELAKAEKMKENQRAIDLVKAKELLPTFKASTGIDGKFDISNLTDDEILEVYYEVKKAQKRAEEKARVKALEPIPTFEPEQTLESIMLPDEPEQTLKPAEPELPSLTAEDSEQLANKATETRQKITELMNIVPGMTEEQARNVVQSDNAYVQELINNVMEKQMSTPEETAGPDFSEQKTTEQKAEVNKAMEAEVDEYIKNHPDVSREIAIDAIRAINSSGTETIEAPTVGRSR